MAFGEHSSKSIIGTKSKELEGKRIVLCITGSVAAIRSPDVARELMRCGADVHVVMSSAAQKIIHIHTLEWATGNPVVAELTGKIEHVAFGGDHTKRADLILVAPSTANTIGKVASGIDDTPVTTLLTTAIGAGIPVIIAPAMHSSMYRHPIVVENIKKLESIGIQVLMPRFSDGKAKIPDTPEIISAVKATLARSTDLKGLRVLVTAGPTRAYIDAFRYITNPSSGKMGVAIAEEALSRGAEVTIVYGPALAIPPSSAKVIKIETTEEMLNAVVSELKTRKYDIAIFSAAASDFGIPDRKMEKVSSSQGEWVLRLVALPKIISEVKKIDAKIFLVGFKAEYNIKKDELIDRSYNRLKEMKMDLIVANDVSQENAGFGVDTNEVYIIDKNKSIVHIVLSQKREIASKLL
ncbi:MAG: bifunctional phosphopantothenoylcysteine decarboxylase/phosphopantothenate--cysteine ligase CoaBC, partial [Candidatus Bathyarchaeota archaeon]|nr:bifunctional phosphopantothenoylcysteine decarboxylase/phosphopantothenate--cysteine ligase CoaBC [Candidatus Bathyarchaeota archaeon]